MYGVKTAQRENTMKSHPVKALLAIAAFAVGGVEVVNAGSITIEKSCDSIHGGLGRSFDFTLGGFGGSSTPDCADGSVALACGESLTCDDLTAGDYTVDEWIPEGWDLSDVNCNNDDSQCDPAESPNATVTLPPGAAETIVFANTKRGTIEVVKSLVASGPASESFTFDAGGDFFFDGVGGIVTQTVLFGDGGATGPIEVLPGGAYTVTEADPTNDGWALTSAVCNNGSEPPIAISVSPGEDVVCTFTNTPLELDTDGDGNPDWTDPDDDNDGISDPLDRSPRDDSNAECTTNDGTNATLVGATISAEQTTCASKESVDVSGTTNVGIDGDLLLISERVSLTDTSVTDNGRIQVINADPCEGCGDNNLPPVIAFPTGGATFNNIAPVNLDPAATLSDVDSPDFDTGDLAVSVALSAALSMCDVSDLLTVENQGMGVSQIGFDGTNVSFEGTVFGSVTMPYSCVDLGGGTFDITPLLITFGPNASQAAVTTLLRALQYFTGSADDQDREASAIVTDGDGGTSNTAVTTIATNLNQAPIFSANNYAFDIDENSAAGTVVGTVVATDPDLPPQTLTFSISGGADSASFDIGASTGALSINTVLDYENPIDVGADNVYDVQVTVTDDGTPNLSDTAAVSVNVNDVNEP